MIRAAIKDRRGDIIRDVMTFNNRDHLGMYCDAHKAEFARLGQQVVELPPSPLNDDQLAQLEHLQRLAGQANGIVKRFVVDRDLHRRCQNRTPTKADLKLFGDALRDAADQFEQLGAAEYGIKD